MKQNLNLYDGDDFNADYSITYKETLQDSESINQDNNNSYDESINSNKPVHFSEIKGSIYCEDPNLHFDENDYGQYDISFGLPDILFTLTVGNSKTNIISLIGKMFIARELYKTNLKVIASLLHTLKIDKLVIMSITSFDKPIKRIDITEPSNVSYIEINNNVFLSHIQDPKFDFSDYNKDTLYILRDGNYMDVKNLFSNVKGYDTNLGRGGSQKAHVLSPLDLRLSMYLLVLTNFAYKQLTYLNTFNDLTKDRYLPYRDNKFNFKSINSRKNNTNDDDISDDSIEVLKEHKVNKFDKHYFGNVNHLDSLKLLSNTLSMFRKINNFNNVPISPGKRGYHTSSKDLSKDETNNSAVFTYLDDIENIIKNNSSLYDAQMEIETSWIDLIKKKLEDPSVSSWRMLPYLIKKAVSTLEKFEQRGILKRRFKLFSTDLSEKKMECVLLTMAMLVSNYNKMSATNLSIQIGNSISFLLFKESLVNVKDINIKLIFNNWKLEHDLDSNAKLLKLGDYFVNLFTNEPTQIFEFGLDDDDIIDTNSERIIKIAPEYIDIIRESLIVPPTSLPMICQPGEWSDTSYGGFLDNKFNKDPINTGSEYHGHKINNKEYLYKAVNILNKIEFKVNKELLDYILTEGCYLLEDKDNQKKSFQNSITIKVAKVYSNTNFYLNVNSDWRGRLYTNSFFLTYQGSDLSRSLIEFAEGEKLTDDGLKYLYIFGANCYSNTIGKRSVSYRISWVKNNLNSIIELDKDFIKKANKKIQFASFCLTMRNYKLNNDYLVKLPVFLDATCSGIQHLAAMLKDINLATNVNLLTKTEDDSVNDLYGSVVDPLNNAINKYGKENTLYSALSNVKLNRKIIKTPIMTKVYSVTVAGIYSQLAKKLEKEKLIHPTEKNKHGKPKVNTYYYVPDKKGNNIKLSYLELYKIAEIVSNISFDMYPSLKEIYNYFINSVKLMLKLKIPIIWFTPAGLVISQNYFASEITKVKLSYFGKTRTSVIREWKGIVDCKKQSQGIVPNIIHSLDASHLINVINCGNNKDISPIICIHDCFGTHPNKMNRLAKIVRSEFVLLYTDHNFLDKYHDRVMNNINDNHYDILEKNGERYVIYYKTKEDKDGIEILLKKKVLIPVLPKSGDLDIKEVINAIYLIN